MSYEIQGDIPLNGQTPMTDADLYALRYQQAQTEAMWQAAKSAYQCTVAPPSSMPSAGTAQDAALAQQNLQDLIITPRQLTPEIIAQQYNGASLDPGDVSQAPAMVPYVTLPSMGAPTRRFPKARRRLQQPGTPWAVAPAAEVNGSCAIPATSGTALADRFRQNPIGAILLLMGGAAVISAAFSKR